MSCSSNPKWAKLVVGLGGAAPETCSFWIWVNVGWKKEKDHVCAAIDLQIEFLSQFHHFGLSQTAEFLMLNIEVLLKGRIVNLQTEEIKKKKNSIQDVYLFTYTFVLMYIYKGHLDT